MAAGIVPDVKDEEVVCQKPCNHTDCAASRESWGEQSKCPYCGEGFKAGQRFYYEWEERDDPQARRNYPVHALCLEEKIEKERSR